ncbi:DUF637 domain-containing protein [Paraburkholderia graminis]|uniref:DUF637 domain-containing protein n=2 Tax=Paraburkholderia graminis TaxID=60548 RepID=UPI0031D318C2
MPTVTALMPQVYFPPNWSAMSAGGNIIGQNVTLDFNQDGQGSILNTGAIGASNRWTVNTGTLTNQANEVNVGDIWQYIAATGYEKTSGTEVQPGGFMSAASMNLNVQKLEQIGGALQLLGSDGTADQAGTQQFIANLAQQLGTNFTQTTVSDHLDTSFTAMGGFGAAEIVGLAFAVVVSIITAGAASEAIGATLGTTLGTTAGSTSAAGTAATTATATSAATVATTAGLGNIALSAAFAGFTSSIASQLTMTGSLDWGSAFEAAGVAGITAGLTNRITYNSDTGFDFTTAPSTVGGPTSSLASLAGVNPSIGTTVNQATVSTASTLETRALAMLAEAGISAGVGTAIEGGSLLGAFQNALLQETAASGAYAIGDGTAPLPIENVLGHAVLGCAASSLSGTGCTGGAIGAATSATLSPLAIIAMDPTGAPLTEGQAAVVTALSVLTGGVAAGLAGGDAQAGATWAENEATNNSEKHTADILKACLQSSFCSAMLPAPAKIAAIGYVASATGSSKDDSGNNLPQLPDHPGNNDDDLSGGSQGQHASGFTLAGTPIPVCVPYGDCTFVIVPVPTSFSLPSIGAIFSTGPGSDSGTSGDSTKSGNNDNTKGGVNSATNSGGLTAGEQIGMLRDAATGKGNFALGEASTADANVLGQDWVGPGYRVSQTDGSTLISADGLRQYRPPSPKPNSSYATTGVQANFQSRSVPSGAWQNNGHLNITGP